MLQKKLVFNKDLASVEMQELDSPVEASRKWLGWACLLVGLYLAVGMVGWNRTLIPDEILPLLLAAKPLRELLEYLHQDLLQTPLSFLLQRWWLGVFGQTDSAAKAFALLLNIPTLLLFTWLASQVTSHWRLTAFLFSSLFLRIGSAVNLVRMHGMVLLLTVIALVIWEQWRKRPSSGKLLAWIAVMILLVYTHGAGLLLLPVFVAMNWLYGPRRGTFAIVSVAPLLALLPWIAYLFPVYQARSSVETLIWLRTNPIITLGQIPFFFLSGEDSGGGSPMPLLHRPDLRIALVLAAGVAHILLLVLACRGIYRFRPLNLWGDDKWRVLWCAAMLCGIPVITLFVYSLLIRPGLHARYVLLGLPGYWLLVVLLGQLGGRAGGAMVAGIFFPWVLLSVVLIFAQSWTPSPYRRTTEFLAREIRNSDLILCQLHMTVGWQVYWEWTRRLGMNPSQVETLPSRVPAHANAVLPAKSLNDLDLVNVNRVWFVLSNFPNVDNTNSVDTVSNFLGARGFRLEKNAEPNIPLLMVFTKIRDAAPGFGR